MEELVRAVAGLFVHQQTLTHLHVIKKLLTNH